MSLPLFQVDAFTAEPFHGNPAAVVLLDHERAEDWMQKVAAEMNLAETAFLLPTGTKWALRWFTPTVEVELCGHATLASCHVLWQTGRIAPTDIAQFDTRSGRLTAARRGDTIELDFPARPATEAPEHARAVAALLNGTPRWVGQNHLEDLLVRLERADEVTQFKPNFDRIAALDAGGLIITAPASEGRYDFVSRYFTPQQGINEDSVTGAAHCALGPYWSKELNREVVTGFQASQRGGTVRVTMRGSRVGLAGHAVTVFRGELMV